MEGGVTNLLTYPGALSQVADAASFSLWPRAAGIEAAGTSGAKLSPLSAAVIELIATCDAPLLDLAMAREVQRTHDGIATQLTAAAMFGGSHAPQPVVAWQVMQLALLMVSESTTNTTASWEYHAGILGCVLNGNEPDLVRAVADLGVALMEGSSQAQPIGARQLRFGGKLSTGAGQDNHARTACATFLVISSALAFGGTSTSARSCRSVMQAVRAGWDHAFGDSQSAATITAAAQRLQLRTLTVLVTHSDDARRFAMLKVQRLLREAREEVVYVRGVAAELNHVLTLRTVEPIRGDVVALVYELPKPRTTMFTVLASLQVSRARAVRRGDSGD